MAKKHASEKTSDDAAPGRDIADRDRHPPAPSPTELAPVTLPVTVTEDTALLDGRQYRERVEQVVSLVLGSVGLTARKGVRTREKASA